MQPYLMSMTVWFPLVGAVLQGFFSQARSRWVTLFFSIVSSCLGLWMVFNWNSEQSGFQQQEIFSWMGTYAIYYDLGLDGSNALLLILISLLFPVLFASEFDRPGIQGMQGLFLVLQTTFLGAALAQDLFFQFFFLSLASFPFYFLIGIFGNQQREEAAYQWMMASLWGFLFFLMGLLMVYYASDPPSLSLRTWFPQKLMGREFLVSGVSVPFAPVAFLWFILGLAVRLPIWPFQGWFYQVLQQAPASVGVALGAGFVPLILYTLIKIAYVLFPFLLSDFQFGLMAVGLSNLVLGAFWILSQRTLSGFLAFIALSQVGWILTGVGSLNEYGLVGAFYQIFAFGLSFALFGLLDGFIRARTKTSAFLDEERVSLRGGMLSEAPHLALLTGLILAATLGFPGLGGFVGQTLIVMGGIQWSFFLFLGVLFFFLWMGYALLFLYQALFLGPVRAGEADVSFLVLSSFEKLYLLPLVGALLFLGFYPKPAIDLIRPAILQLLAAL